MRKTKRQSKNRKAGSTETRARALNAIARVRRGASKTLSAAARAEGATVAVAAVSKTDDVTAAKAVVDEYQDDGIDAFFFDSGEHVAYLVQSKWIKDGTSSPDLGSILKFIQGINHFLENKVTMLGPKLQSKSSDIQDALADSQARFVLVVVYTGKPPLSAEVSAPLAQLLADLNDVTDSVS